MVQIRDTLGRALIEPEGRLKVATGASPWFGCHDPWSPLGAIERLNRPDGAPRRMGIALFPGLALGAIVKRPTGSDGSANPADANNFQAIGPPDLSGPGLNSYRRAFRGVTRNRQ